MPVIQEPIQRIAMDFVDPLPRTTSGNQWLYIMPYAMWSYETQKVAEKLMDLILRHGIPHEILTDWRMNFTFQHLYELLGIKSITSPYHPQMDGMVRDSMAL